MNTRTLTVLRGEGVLPGGSSPPDFEPASSSPSEENSEENSRTHSIIDNVLGPVGPGPSSSHTMAPHRAALEAFGLLGGRPEFARIQFVNSFATTGEGHRSNIAVAAGLLGMAPEDPRFKRALDVAYEEGIEFAFEKQQDDAEHPNTVFMELRRGARTLRMKVISTGGGNYESITADFTGRELRRKEADAPAVLRSDDAGILKALPVLERALKVTRPTWRGYARLAGELGMGCDEFALLLETYIQLRKGGLRTPDEVRAAAGHILRVMLGAVEEGGREPQQTQLTEGDWGKRLFNVGSIFGGAWPAFAGAIAAQEFNAGMGVVAAAPTGGASGTLPGVLYGLMNALDLPRERLVKALMVAGLVGQVAFSRGPVSGARSGCGGEIGVAAMMAAGAASYLMGGDWETIDAAAALSGQPFVGLECSPANGLVVYPCVPRNGFAALIALASAEAAGAGIRPPRYGLDATLDRIFAIGSLLPRELRETEDGDWAASLVTAECCGKGGCVDCPTVA